MRHARKTDPVSSHEAAAENAKRRPVQIAMVAKIVAQRAPKIGKTSAELSVSSGIDRYTIARRLSDAERKGLVARGESRLCAVSGRIAVTWRKA